MMLSSKYQRTDRTEQQITSLREELSKMEQDMIGAEKWIELIKEYSVPKELTAPLLNAMIEKILHMKQQRMRITKEYRKLRYITDLSEKLSNQQE